MTVPEGWQRLPLGALGTFVKSRGGSKKDESASGVPVIRYGELYTQHDEIVRGYHSFVPRSRADDYTLLKKGDVLFAGSGETHEEIGKSAVLLDDAEIRGSGDIIILRPGPSADPRFLGYATNGPRAIRQKMRMGQGSSVIHIYAHNLQRMMLDLPPLPEQRKIAAILSSVDDAIAATEAVIEQTRIVKQGLLQDLLTKGIGHTRFKQTPIGEVPESWEVVRLCAVSERITDGTHQSVRTSSTGTIPFLYVSCIRDGQIHWQKASLIDRDVYEVASKGRRTVEGDVLYTAVGSYGHAATVPDDRQFTFQRHIALIQPKRSRVVPAYITAWLNSRLGRVAADRLAVGNAQLSVTLRDLKDVRLPLPPIAEQTKIVQLVDSAEYVTHDAEDSVNRCRVLKSGLLQDLLTGTVRVTP